MGTVLFSLLLNREQVTKGDQVLERVIVMAVTSKNQEKAQDLWQVERKPRRHIISIVGITDPAHPSHLIVFSRTSSVSEKVSDFSCQRR